MYWDKTGRSKQYRTRSDAASDQGLHCLPLIQQFLETPQGCKMDLFKT